MKPRPRIIALATVTLMFMSAAKAESSALQETPVALHTEPGVVSLFVELFTYGGLAGDQQERAAFIVRTADGSYGMEWWREFEGPRRAEFHGRIPDNAVAVVHTHPFRFPRASMLDEREAQRIGLPFYVLTLVSIWVIEPSQGRSTELHRGRWIDNPEAATLISRVSTRRIARRHTGRRTLIASAR